MVTRCYAALAALMLAATVPATAQTTTSAPNPNLSVASVRMDGGVRASKIIGSGIYSDPNTQIATVNDLLMAPDNKVVLAVLSVGGVLGVGGKLVAVPYAQLKLEGGKTMLPGATKESLNAMPDFTFNG